MLETISAVQEKSAESELKDKELSKLLSKSYFYEYFKSISRT